MVTGVYVVKSYSWQFRGPVIKPGQPSANKKPYMLRYHSGPKSPFLAAMVLLRTVYILDRVIS